MENRQTNDGKPQQDQVLSVGQYYHTNNLKQSFISNAMVPSMVNHMQIPFPLQLVQTTSSPIGRETKFNLLQMTGNRSQLLELSNSKNLVSNVVMASDNNQIMLQTKPPNMKGGHQILKAVNKSNQASLVKCVPTTANSIQPQQKIIFTNGINNNQTTVIRKGINDRTDNSQTQNTVIHSRPTTGVATGVANGIDVSYLRQGVIQNPITMKTGNGQRTVIGQMPMQTLTANPNIVYYPTANFSQGTFASSGQLQASQIRDAVNNNQPNITHHNLTKALSNGCQFVQLIPNPAMISQASTITSAAPHTAQLVTTQAPISSSEVVTLQKPDRPAILKRQRPQVSTSDRRAPFGSIHPPCPKVSKVDVEPVHIKVAAGTVQVTTASPLPTTMLPTNSTSNIDQPGGASIASAVPITSSLGTKRTIPSSTSIPTNSGFTSGNIAKLSELSNSNDRTNKIEKAVLSPTINSPTQQPLSMRPESVICSPRKPRKQTLIRKEQTSNIPPRLTDPTTEPKKLTDEVSTDEADEFEDEPASESTASENRTENRLKLEISRDTSSSTSSSSRRDKHTPTKRSNIRGNSHIISPSTVDKPPSTFGFSSRQNPGKILIGSTTSLSPKSPKLDNHKSCVRLRIFGGQSTPSTSKKERDNLRHFSKHSDVKLSSADNLSLGQLRLLTKATSSKVDAVNKAVRQMQKEESSVYNILEDIKSKLESDNILHELMQSNLLRAKEGVHQLNESHAAACRLLSHYLKVEKPDKKDVPLLKKLLKKAKQKF